MCELKTKHFKAVCPYTNSEMEISILCQRIHKTQTLNKHYKKMDFSCPKISECTYGKRNCPLFQSAYVLFMAPIYSVLF